MSDGTDEAARPGILAVAATFGALLALTASELMVVAAGMDRARRITTLAGLLMAKVGIVIAFFMRARQGRPAVRLALTAILLAVGAAIILMLETVFRAGVQ